MNQDKAKLLHSIVQKHIDGWYVDNATEERIKHYVHKKLNDSRDEIFYALLGLKKDVWGSPKIDKPFESLVKRVFEDEIDTAIKQVFQSSIKMSDTQKNKIAEKYNDFVYAQIEKHFSYRASAEDAKPIIDALTKEFSADTLKETLKLLKGE